MQGSWQRAYVLQNGLKLGVPYGIANYPASINPSTDGLRNITGRVNADQMVVGGWNCHGLGGNIHSKREWRSRRRPKQASCY